MVKEWDQASDFLIALDAISGAIVWLNTFTVEYPYLEDLEWMDQHLMSCMNQDLRKEVKLCLKHEFPSNQWSSPLSFSIMIDKCINLSETAIDILKGNIENLDRRSMFVLVIYTHSVWSHNQQSQ